jgi:hypothetical protein
VISEEVGKKRDYSGIQGYFRMPGGFRANRSMGPSQYVASRAALTALSGNDFEVGEISAHSAAAPEADQPFLAVAQLSDD